LEWSSRFGRDAGTGIDAREVSESVDEQRVREAIQAKEKDGRISCTAAFEVARETGALPRVVGRLLNEMKVKIVGCQLGCFE
jgi:hypothetical protein